MKEDKVAKILKRRLYRHYAKQYNEEITLGIGILTPIDKAIRLMFPRFKDADREKCNKAIDNNIWALKELYDIKARIRERERLKPSSPENDRLKQALENYLKVRLKEITWRITHPYTKKEAEKILNENKEQLTKNEEPTKNKELTLSESEIVELVEELTTKPKKTSATDDMWNLLHESAQPKNPLKLRAEEILADNYDIIPKRVIVDAAILKAMLFPPTYFDTFKHHFYHSYPLLPVRWVSGLTLLVLGLIATPLYGCCLGYMNVVHPGLSDENLKLEKGIQGLIDSSNALTKKSSLSQSSSENNSEYMEATTRCFCFNLTPRKKKRKKSTSL